MAYDNQARVIALSGLYQAVHCVIRIARHGEVDRQAMEPCIYSLLQIDAPTASAVFGTAGAVEAGARQIVSQLTGQPERNLELMRYAVQIIKLERNLSQRTALRSRIRQGIEEAATKRERLELLHPDLLSHFAAVYSNTLSTLEPRIVVRGDAAYLDRAENKDRVRSLLLAAVRAATLWRQVGGSRWQLLLSSSQILKDARSYISAHLP